MWTGMVVVASAAIDPASVAYTLKGGLQTHQVALVKPPSLKPGSLNLSWQEGSRRSSVLVRKMMFPLNSSEAEFTMRTVRAIAPR